MSCLGQLPDPPRYGEWLRYRQADASSGSRGSPPSGPTSADARAPSAIPFSPTQQESPSMKHKKQHTGLYCCPECCLEYDLVAEESLKCDECGGPLVSGSLDDFEDGEEEGAEEPR